MSLSEVKEKLYKKKNEGNLAEDSQIVFSDSENKVNPKEAGFEKTGDAWTEKKDSPVLVEKKNKAIKVVGIIFASILVVALLVVGFYFFKKTSFNEERVSVEINGLQEVASGKKLNYEIVINNNNRAKLQGAFLKISYSENFIQENNSNFTPEGVLGGSFQLGDIEGKEQKKINFNGKVYSPKGTIIYLKAELIYSPNGFNGQFSSENQIGLNINSSPIILGLLAPQNISSGDSLDYLVTYKNDGNEDYNNIKIKMEYPDGFTFSKANPIASEGENIWYIGRLSAGQEGKIVVSGKLEGEKNSVKNSKVYVGEIIEGQFIAQNEEKTDTLIGASPLAINQTANGLKELSVNAGETLKFKIDYKNEGATGLNDVIITEKIDSSILDYTTLKAEGGGSFDINNKIITWKASGVSGLKTLNPGDSGSIKFEIKVKDIVPVAGIQDKNFVISSIAKIDSPDILTSVQGNKIVSGNKMDIKLNSKLFLTVSGSYHDAFTDNSGSLPPKVGEKTTYVIKWSLINISNDIVEGRVESSLPSGVTFTNKIYPENSNLTFDERTNSIVWDLGNVDAGTGILTSPKEVSFQIGLTPTPSQAGSHANIIDSSMVSGKDSFTGENLSFTVKEKTTLLSEDKKIKQEEYRIKE